MGPGSAVSVLCHSVGEHWGDGQVPGPSLPILLSFQFEDDHYPVSVALPLRGPTLHLTPGLWQRLEVLPGAPPPQPASESPAGVGHRGDFHLAASSWLQHKHCSELRPLLCVSLFGPAPWGGGGPLPGQAATGTRHPVQKASGPGSRAPPLLPVSLLGADSTW